MTANNMLIREEIADDIPGIRYVNEAAFPTPAEADLVDRLRGRGLLTVSLVAVDDDGLVAGHAAFSPVTLHRPGGEIAAIGAGLGPVAVLPDRHRNGIGSRLIEAGISRCRQRGDPFVVVLGHPAYYHRFGFARAADRAIANRYGVDDEFMVLELTPGAIPAEGGAIRYAPPFDELPA